jgi:flagellar biosynthesis chaperone FliJ
MAVKFDKFKKDLLAAVSRITKSQETIDVTDIRQQLAELKVIIHQLEEFENYYTKTEIDENYYTKALIDEKTSNLNNTINVLNGSVSSLSRRVVGMESSVSDMLSTLNTISSLDYSKFVIATDLSGEEDLDI